ncbi:hypothetical protein GN958_ATG15073 [Phytophthora infestans]|uniref:Uncharacterized protein n=1 Tax=Phytophthora infestans TaxID=4787 RepID=A0A8S9U8X0_PHYIN|nr:hypothetical protein GN958_ATG15073 [Phytophthora infestans]
MKGLKDGLLESVSKVEATRLDTVQDIISELEKRAIGAGTATYDGLHDAIRACLHDSGVGELVEKLSSRQESVVDAATEGNEGQLCHCWSGKFRRIPANFTIPDCSVRHVWVLWMCGNKSKQIPPLRRLDGRDMPNRKMQKRLSQLRFVVLKIEKDATSKELFPCSTAIDAATDVFIKCASSVAVDDITEHSRKRRHGQLSWATVGKLLRKKAKQQVVSSAYQ